ncbi:hypothetical protein [Streptococcus dentiloxodontae]
MKLTITAANKPKGQDFHYQFELSDKQLILSTLFICSTFIICSAFHKKTKK